MVNYRGYLIHFRSEVLSWRFMAAPLLPRYLFFLGEHPRNSLQGTMPWQRPRSRLTTCCWIRRYPAAVDARRLRSAPFVSRGQGLPHLGSNFPAYVTIRSQPWQSVLDKMPVRQWRDYHVPTSRHRFLKFSGREPLSDETDRQELDTNLRSESPSPGRELEQAVFRAA